MAGAGGAIILALLIFVLPRFAAIYANRAATLPMPTRVLLATANFLRDQWWWYLPLLAVVVVSVMAWSRTASARRQIDVTVLRMPLIRSVVIGAMVSRWTRTLSVLCTAGVNLVDAVSIVRGATNSPSQKELWDDVERSIRDGRPLAASLEESTLVPPGVSAMISAGERSGRLPEVLVTIADCSEEDLETTVKRTTSLIEPAMIVTLGLVVGLIALAMLLPVFGMSGMVSS
jgi:type II secretory pathway component PulF